MKAFLKTFGLFVSLLFLLQAVMAIDNPHPKVASSKGGCQNGGGSGSHGHSDKNVGSGFGNGNGGSHYGSGSHGGAGSGHGAGHK